VVVAFGVNGHAGKQKMNFMKKMIRQSTGAFLEIALVLIAICVSANHARAASYAVSNLSNSGAGSLRAAVISANSDGVDSDISFDATFFATLKTITLTGSQLDLGSNGTLSITGPAAGVEISGGSAVRVLAVGAGANVTLTGLTILRGKADTGAGIHNSGTVTVNNCTLSINAATDPIASGYGGGLYNLGTATVNDSTITGNSATWQGGGIHNGNNLGNIAAVLTLNRCLVRNNTTDQYGGGLSVQYAATATVRNCTFYNNVADLRGAGVYNGGGTSLASCTFVVNSNLGAQTGGGVYGHPNASGGTALTNCLGAQNAPDSFAGSYGNNGGNIQASTVQDAGLNPTGLADNGGPTQTIALVAKRSAIATNSGVNAGVNAGAVGLDTDQRGGIYPRIFRGAVDSGAFESPFNVFINNNNWLTLAVGATATITEDKLKATDSIGDPVTYTVTSGPSYGTVNLNGNPTNSFTQADINAGYVTYTQNGTFVASDSFGFSAGDGKGGYDAATFTIMFSEAPSLVVTTTADTVATDGITSLREAIAYANSNADQSTITFNIPTNMQTGGVWVIGTGSKLQITQSVTITGPGANLLTVKENDANKSFGVLEWYYTNSSSSVSGLTITSGAAGIGNIGTSQLAVTNCILINNGTGIFNEGTLTLTNCTISKNTSPALVNNSGGNATLTACTLSNNSDGIINSGTATVTDCTLSGGTSNGIVSGGTSTLTNCTISGNAQYGYINTNGTASTLKSCTLSGNQIGVLASSGSTAITNCTLTGNTGTGLLNVSAAVLNNSLVVGNGTNLGGGNAPTGTNNITTGTAAAAGLDPSGLQDNSGLTKTIALLVGGTAINAGNDAMAPTTDQRGYTRVGTSDIGAFEFGAAPPPVGSVQFSSATYTVGEAAGTATITVTRTGGTSAANVNYAAAPGTAANPADFATVSGTLQFGSGETSKTFTVSIVNDTAVENSETINLTLSAPSGASIGAPSTATLTITDNDVSGYSISGRVVTSTGTGISGVSVSRGSGSPVLTDTSGNYTFNGVPAGTYTLTPTRSSYAFSPATRSVTISSANAAGQNFTGYNSTINGRVAFSNGVGIAGVEVRLNSGGRTAITNGAGYYVFTSMLNGAYTVTPVLAGYSFNPTYKSVVISNANVVNVNFIGGYAINGRVASSSGVGLVGIRVYRTGSSVAAVTNGAGYYAFDGVVNGTYTLTPDTTQGYGYTPTTRGVTIAGGSVNNQNFVGTTGYRVSGRIGRSNGTAIPNVSVTRTGSATPVTTNGAGYYTFNGVPNGTYTLTPSLSGFTFAPTTKSVTVNGADPAAQNFIGTGP